MQRIFFILIFSFLVSCSSTKGQHIVYDLPESVTNKVKEYFNIARTDSIKFIAKLTNDGSGKYTLSVINYDFAGLENFKLIENVLVKRTSRMIRVDKVLMPLITDEDFLFADFGTEKMKDGRTAKKKVLFTSESYTITFDKNGKIYER